MNWQPRRLDQCAKFSSGGTPSKANAGYWVGNIPWVSSGEMNQSFIDDTELHVSADGAANGTRMVPKHTVLAVVRGMSLANEFRISITQREMTFNQDIKALHCVEGIDPHFLFYALKARKNHIRDLATEASHGTKKLETDTLGSVEILVPETLEAQKAAASIALNYDDLIENNRRRIALLEDAARQLYKEWFVRFRFPGHEHVKIINGVPEGWATKLLSEICLPKDGIQTGPFGSQLHQSDYTKEGVPVVMPKDMKGRRIDVEGAARIAEELADRLGRHRMKVGDTVYGRRGDIGRKAYIGLRQDGWFCGTGCLRIRPNPSEINPRYLFETLGTAQTAGFIANQAKGTTMANLSAGALKSVPILCSPSKLQDMYSQEVEPQFEMIETLADQSHQLVRARDLLLPKLMSGAIAV